MSDFQIPEWVTWVFSGVGVVVAGFLLSPVIKGRGSAGNVQTVEINLPISKPDHDTPDDKKVVSIDEIKSKIKILFIDDAKFKVVDILKSSNWVNTKSVRDVKDINSVDIRETHVFFVDIHGVGVSLGFKDEGLGLALAIKEKYPSKKVVIYSSETNGERFHEAFKKADDSLPKNADPYEFEQIIENFGMDIFGG